MRGSRRRDDPRCCWGASALGLALTGRAFAKETKAPPKPQNVLSPDASLKRLTEGNARYVDGVSWRILLPDLAAARRCKM